MPRPAKNQHVVAVLRQAIGLGQQQLAARIGVSKSALQKIELKERTLTRETAKRIADHTGVDLDWLLAGDYAQPPLAATEGLLTPEKYGRHRAWVESGKPVTDAQWTQFQRFAQGATITLAGGERRIPEDPLKQRRQMEDSATQEMSVEVLRDGKSVPLPKGLQGLERSIIKRMQADARLNLRRSKVAELRRGFEVLTQAVFEHRDGDFLLWQLKEQLAEFGDKHGLT
jgi:transcriptional regulator with XRE-family HTH domain